ncbi:MAG: glycogen/starch synthase [Candidatus Caldarchaeum sp.]|nr:glycogen/starch synthase [Candidatus Caldarchaeum sp.]MDW8359898.1 glycogen/starch synthase [Candidatus Caldarchaeum sp.]
MVSKPSEVWMLSFEYEGFVKAGGLGAAVARYCRALAAAGVSTTVLIPSHGRHRQSVSASWRGERRGVDGNIYPYSVGAEAFQMDGVRIVSFRGLDQPTSRFLDEAEIYREAPEKTSLYTRAVVEWARTQPKLPEVVHSNDWTTALAAMALKTMAFERRAGTAWVHTTHLISSPSFPWHYASEQWSGLRSIQHKIQSHNGFYSTWVSDAWDSVGGNVDAFAALESDVLVSVSYGYLETLLSRWGFAPRAKACVVHNSTDWSLSDVENYLKRSYGTVSRSKLRPVVLKTLWSSAKHVEGSLHLSRLLAVAHGRVVWQKGYDTLLNSLDYADPELGVLILGLPSGDTGHEDYLRRLTHQHYGRAALTLEPLPQQLIQSIVYAANVAAVPSRYEPFGISSIEAQALGTPVVAANVPGLSETVKKIEEGGAAVFTAPDDAETLGRSLTSLAWLTESVDTENPRLADRAPLEFMRRLYPQFRSVRMNAVRWVDENFREKNTGEMLLKCYEKALETALQRVS